MGLMERQALKRCEGLIQAYKLPDESVLDFDIGKDSKQRVDLIVTTKGIWLLRDQDQTLEPIFYPIMNSATWTPLITGSPEGTGTWALTVLHGKADAEVRLIFEAPRSAGRTVVLQFRKARISPLA